MPRSNQIVQLTYTRTHGGRYKWENQDHKTQAIPKLYKQEDLCKQCKGKGSNGCPKMIWRKYFHWNVSCDLKRILIKGKQVYQ